MKYNMIEENKRSVDGKDFIRLTKEGTDTKGDVNPCIKEAFIAIPKELKDAIKQYDTKNKKGESGTGFWVREEWLLQLMGSPSVSIIDNKTVSKYTNAYMKKFILIAEHIIKHLAYFSKQNIIIRNPKILIGNIMSNINLSISKGASPIKV